MTVKLLTSDIKDTVDEETEQWPVSTSLQSSLSEIKRTHKALPIPVYENDDTYVPPLQVPARLKGVLVQVFFRLKHYLINNNDPTAKFNSFNGIIEQIIILRDAPSKLPNIYRENIRAGPRRLTVTQPTYEEQKKAAECSNSVPAPSPIDSSQNEPPSSQTVPPSLTIDDRKLRYIIFPTMLTIGNRILKCSEVDLSASPNDGYESDTPSDKHDEKVSIQYHLLINSHIAV